MTILYCFVMNPPNENVLVVRRSLFDQLASFQGLNFEPQKYLDAFLSRGNNFFLPRSEAENNPNYKQIIPYALIVFRKTVLDRKSTRLNSSHVAISYAVFCL